MRATIRVAESDYYLPDRNMQYAMTSGAPIGGRMRPLAWLLICGCVDSGVVSRAQLDQTPTEECRVDGLALGEVEPPRAYCFTGVIPHAVASALRYYQQERYGEAAAWAGSFVDAGPPGELRMWWFLARFVLGRSYAHLGRQSEADAIFLEIVRDPGDPYRWAAAGWFCGERRPFGEFPPCE
jgi:hypothetical protein